MTRISIDVDEMHVVSGIVQMPSEPAAIYVLAHGAGAGMEHPFMAAVSDGLATRGIATLRYQFPYMESGSKRPDRPALAQATVRAAVKAAARLTEGLPIFAGGKSFGGRMTSQAQAEASLPGVLGLVFLGFPLHAAKKPSTDRAAHLGGLTTPMLFVQGTRDALAEPPLLEPVVARLPHADLVRIDDGDHSFHVRANSGRTDADAMEEILGAVAAWVKRTRA